MRPWLLAVYTMVAALLPASADAKWTQVRSENFIFVGEVSEGTIRRIAQKLEQFREVMQRALPGSTAASPVPTVVVVFASDKSLQPVAPLFNGKPIEVAGYFQGGEDLNYIALDAQFVEPALRTVFHEYSHFLVSNSVGPLPAWANEGLAEVYEVVMERDGGKKAVVGAAPQQHVELLKSSTLIPIRELLAVDHQSPVYNEGNRRGVFYAQSWALVHHLTFGNPERAKQFRQFLASVRSGSPESSAFSEAFGDLNELDRELFKYVRNYLFNALIFDFGEKVAAGAVQKGQTLDDLEASIYLADLQGRVGRLDESRARLTAITKQNPNAARAHAALGMQDFRDNHLDTALPLLERAASIGTSDSWVQNAYGRALIASIGSSSVFDGSRDTVQRAHTVLSRAVELDSNSAFAAGMLGYVELILGSDVARAASLLERATQLAPSREQYRLFLAQAWLRQREFSKASSQLGPLLANGRDPQIRAQARDMLGQVAEMQNRPAAPQQTAITPTAEQLALLAALSRTPETAEPPTSGPSGPPGSTEAAGPARPVRPGELFRPDLRTVGAGETRVRGQFTAIECGQLGIVLIVQSNGSAVRLRTNQLSEVDFISYRKDTPSSVSCGPMAKVQWVLATYRAGVVGTGPTATVGDAVAVELLPDDYIP
jgi:tetratricopeptide (TPR) repeat protein